MSAPARFGRAARAAATTLVLAATAATSIGSTGGPPTGWTHFARSPQRVAAAPTAPESIGSPRWICGVDASGSPVQLVGQAGPVTHDGRVYVLGRVANEARLFAIDARTGAALWSAPVPSPHLDSWSTPAVDAENGTVLVASGSALTAIDAASGAVRWRAVLGRPVVNASPLVTADRGPADRAFITDYDGFGDAGRLYCINVDPFDAAANPYEPGQIVWSVELGATTGNTPAYADGVVYIASLADESGWSPGVVRAFPAGATAPPPPLWTFVNVKDVGFVGGVCVAGEGGQRAVYAASYASSGGQFSSNLVKLDAATGALLWSADSNRTAATPIPLGDGRIVLSTGIAGFGAQPALQMFRDDGGAATLLWDSALDTWIDADGDGALDPGEFLAVGGWSHQPAWAGDRLYAGVLPAAPGFGPCTDLLVLDLAAHPAEAGFVVARFAGAGSTPAIDDGSLYTVGAAGLHAFGAPTCPADCDGSGSLTVGDFACFRARFIAGDPRTDCDGSGSLGVADFACFRAAFIAGCP